jgi:hypothetical protein
MISTNSTGKSRVRRAMLANKLPSTIRRPNDLACGNEITPIGELHGHPLGHDVATLFCAVDVSSVAFGKGAPACAIS